MNNAFQDLQIREFPFQIAVLELMAKGSEQRQLEFYCSPGENNYIDYHSSEKSILNKQSNLQARNFRIAPDSSRFDPKPEKIRID
jgi:hypothetical protein